MSVNFLAILLCGVASMVIGYFWYSKMLFAEQWMKLSGLKMSDMKGDGVWKNYLVTFGCALLMAYVLALTLKFTGTIGAAESLKMAFWLWLGFVAATSLTNDLFNQVPFKLFLIKSGHHLANMLVASLILAWLG